MLVLARKIGERIQIADHIIVTVLAVNGRKIRLGIQAPPAVAIRREELPCQSAAMPSNAATGHPVLKATGGTQQPLPKLPRARQAQA